MPKLENDNPQQKQQTFELSWDEENDTKIDLNDDNILEEEVEYQNEQNNEQPESSNLDNDEYQEQPAEENEDEENYEEPESAEPELDLPSVEYEIEQDELDDDPTTEQPQEMPSDTIEFDELSVAEILLEARVNKQLTIRDVAERTKIQSDIIKSLEKDGAVINLASVYVKSRIKSLCQEYQIDHQPVVKKYEESLSEEERGNTFSDTGQYGIEDTGFLFDKKKKIKLSMLISGVALIGVVIVVIWGIAHTKIIGNKNSPKSATSKKQQIIDWDDFATPRQIPPEELEIPKN